MQKFISVVVFAILLFAPSSTLAVLCGYCVGRGDVCVTGRGINCGDNLKCLNTEQGGTAPICLPTIEEGKPCTSVGVDTCEVEYVCNRTGSGNCDFAHGQPRALGDYCGDSTWCGTGLTCSNSKCALSDKCTTAPLSGCPVHQFCNIDICTDRAGEGNDCTTKPCHPTLYCDTVANPTAPKCVAPYTKSEGDNCTSTSQCKNGLTCKCIGIACQTKCVKPVYFFLPATGGVAWGDLCDPADPATGTGCQCNYVSKNYMYLKEKSDQANDVCYTVSKDFYKCLSDKGCNGAYTYARSCLRENCYGQYTNLNALCGDIDPTLKPPRCSAQGIAALFSLLFFFLLL